MKIPDSFHTYGREEYLNTLVKTWEAAAIRLSIEHGVCIKTERKWNVDGFLQELVYEVGNHTFGSLKELRKALRNKAFL